jgi:hypothetical protein
MFRAASLIGAALIFPADAQKVAVLASHSLKAHVMAHYSPTWLRAESAAL